MFVRNYKGKLVKIELSKFNITVNSICPGLVKTTMMKKLADDSGKSIKMFQNKQLINSPQTPNDIANKIEEYLSV